MSTAIQVQNISKLYRLGEVGTGSLAHDINRWWHRIRGNEDPYNRIGETNNRESKGESNYVWALKDIDFEIKQGEVVGIIGRNGAGKSTLLKILSRVTSPTTGSIRAKGRIASLLEVGTGFHPELTGRENIFLNGAILGMRKKEISLKLDEIIDFSGCERYIDTPVKRYSSGMYVRLAFAVAAHLDPEIMIIDEVLAVGDGDFQKKCIGKMRSMHENGRTVLIVSHQLALITALCDKAIIVKNGLLDFYGSSADAVINYQSSAAGARSYDAKNSIGNSFAVLQKAWIEDHSGLKRQAFDLDEPLHVKMEFSVVQRPSKLFYPHFHVFDEKGDYVFCAVGSKSQLGDGIYGEGIYLTTCIIPKNFLNAGTFTIGVAVTTMNPGVEFAFFERDALVVQISEDIDATIDERRHGYAGVMPGPMRPALEWRLEPVVNSKSS